MIGQNKMPILGVSVVLIVLLIILAVLIIAFVVLSIIGKRVQKKQAANEEAMKAASQTVSLLVIDKKKMRLKDAGLPPIVVEQTPKYLRRSKVPIVKAKAGPKIMSMMCDTKIFDQLPIKKEVKVTVSGIYIMGIKGARGGIEAPEKLGRFGRFKKRVMDAANSRRR